MVFFDVMEIGGVAFLATSNFTVQGNERGAIPVPRRLGYLCEDNAALEIPCGVL
jgi:hypothetical protein